MSAFGEKADMATGVTLCEYAEIDRAPMLLVTRCCCMAAFSLLVCATTDASNFDQGVFKVDGTFATLVAIAPRPQGKKDENAHHQLTWTRRTKNNAAPDYHRIVVHPRFLTN